MTLTITSAVKVREPGFSRSECLELARRIECGTVGLINDPDMCDDCGGIFCDGGSITNSQTALIVAALRAYASE